MANGSREMTVMDETSNPLPLIPLREAIAISLVAMREQFGVSQRDVADAMTQLGFRWSAPTVTKIEKNRRALTVEELVGLCIVMRVPLSSFCVTPHGHPTVIGTVEMDPATLTKLLEGDAEDRADVYGGIPDLQLATMPGWTKVTWDQELRDLVDKEIAERDAAREKLGIELSDSQRRTERRGLWWELASEQAHADEEGQA
jgi:transcriptional regulator with XRE-family HTH domain